MENILELQDISHSYHGMEGETKALSHLSFSLKPGDFISIVGPSGCGKSTLLSIISGLIPPENGKVVLSGNHIGYMLHGEVFTATSFWDLKYNTRFLPEQRKRL